MCIVSVVMSAPAATVIRVMIVVIAAIIPRIVPSAVTCTPAPAKAESPTGMSPAAAPAPRGVSVWCPAVVPVPRVGPGRCYPGIRTVHIYIPVVRIKKVYVIIAIIADMNRKFGIVEFSDSFCVFKILIRAVESVQIITFLLIGST